MSFCLLPPCKKLVPTLQWTPLRIVPMQWSATSCRFRGP